MVDLSESSEICRRICLIDLIFVLSLICGGRPLRRTRFGRPVRVSILIGFRFAIAYDNIMGLFATFVFISSFLGSLGFLWALYTELLSLPSFPHSVLVEGFIEAAVDCIWWTVGTAGFSY